MGESGLKENFDRIGSERGTIKNSKVINALQADNDYLRDRIRHLEERLKDAGIDLPQSRELLSTRKTSKDDISVQHKDNCTIS